MVPIAVCVVQLAVVLPLEHCLAVAALQSQFWLMRIPHRLNRNAESGPLARSPSRGAPACRRTAPPRQPTTVLQSTLIAW
jgi:hypothetical protein